MVRIQRQYPHPLYRKMVRVHKKLMAHDETSLAAVGDTVAIQECRPLSKNKSFTLASVIDKAAPGTVPSTGFIRRLYPEPQLTAKKRKKMKKAKARRS